MESRGKIELKLEGTPENVTEMLYSLLKRRPLTPVSVFELLHLR